MEKACLLLLLFVVLVLMGCTEAPGNKSKWDACRDDLTCMEQAHQWKDSGESISEYEEVPWGPS